MPAGRPKLYTSEEEVSNIINLYFETIGDEIPTMAGLALALGMSTETLRQYGKDQEFSATIKKARQKVEQAWEMALIKGGSGPIFWLKNNAGWKDKTEQDVNHKGKIVNKVEYVIKDSEDSGS